MRIDVMFTLNGKRDFREFRNKKDSKKFVKEIIAKGASKVFTDFYDDDDDLVNYQREY